jgi:hypothetical protein
MERRPFATTAGLGNPNSRLVTLKHADRLPQRRRTGCDGVAPALAAALVEAEEGVTAAHWLASGRSVRA